MKNFFLIFSTCILYTSAFQASPSQIVDFIDGLIDGLEQNPNSPGICGSNLKTLNSKFATLAQDIQTLLQSLNTQALQKVLDDVQSIQAQIQSFSSDCDWSSLISKLTPIFSQQGLQILLANYFKNLRIINTNLNKLQTCTPNYTSCGVYAGTVFRLMVNWTLNSPSLVPLFDWSFFNGVLTGISSEDGDKCKSDLVDVQPSIENAVITSQKIADGNIFMIGSLENQVISIEDRIIDDAAEDCKWEELGSILMGLKTPEGVTQVVNNYLENWQAVNEGFSSIEDCADYIVCGTRVGVAIKTLIGWETN